MDGDLFKKALKKDWNPLKTGLEGLEQMDRNPPKGIPVFSFSGSHKTA